MPELPEVETVCRHIKPLIVNRRLTDLRVIDELWARGVSPKQLRFDLVGRTLLDLERRGKYLLWLFNGDYALAVHLRMTGNIINTSTGELPHYSRVVWSFSSGEVELAFTDPRRFGTGELLQSSEAVAAFFASRLGVEPFSAGFSVEVLKELMGRSRAPMKSFLLNQRKVAGIGNIYADEALFLAKIHPLQPANEVKNKKIQGLQAAVIQVLNAGIKAKGASIDDFRNPDGLSGGFQNLFLVHRRVKLPCVNCGTPIEKLVVGGRGTYICPKCQVFGDLDNG